MLKLFYRYYRWVFHRSSCFNYSLFIRKWFHNFNPYVHYLRISIVFECMIILCLSTFCTIPMELGPITCTLTTYIIHFYLLSPFHNDFLRGQRNYLHGYGMGALNFEVINNGFKCWHVNSYRQIAFFIINIWHMTSNVWLRFRTVSIHLLLCAVQLTKCDTMQTVIIYFI